MNNELISIMEDETLNWASELFRGTDPALRWPKSGFSMLEAKVRLTPEILSPEHINCLEFSKL
jgi:hypothetical protein